MPLRPDGREVPYLPPGLYRDERPLQLLSQQAVGHYPKQRLFLGRPGARVGDIPSRYAKDVAPRTHSTPASIDLSGNLLVASGA